MDIIYWLSFRQRFVMLLKFVIENEPEDFTHLFELTLVKTVIEFNTSVLLVVNW